MQKQPSRGGESGNTGENNQGALINQGRAFMIHAG